MRIRVATAEDAGAVRTIYAPIVESTPTSFELEAPSEAEMATRITNRQPHHPFLIAEDRHSVTAYAYAGRFSARPAYDWSVETSLYVADRARGHGVGRTLYEALLAVLTAQGYRQAMAGVALPNRPSVRLHEGLGFELVGIYRAAGWKFEAWHDVGWWQRGLADAASPPSSPVPLTDLPDGVLDGALTADCRWT